MLDGIGLRTAGDLGYRQTVDTGEDAIHHLLPERIVPRELVAVLLPAGLGLREIVLHGVLSVGRHHAVQRESRRLLADLNLRIALHQLLAEGRHTQHATACQRRDGQHVTALLKHLGELVEHRAGNPLVLLPAKVRQFAHTRGQLVLGCHELLEECLALRGQRLQVVRLG